MGKKGLFGIITAVCVLFSSICIPAAALTAMAANGTTVSGTVGSQTTDSTLYLSTSGGSMVIKLDSTTDTSSCKVLIPGKTVYVTCYRGSDAYMHASKLSNGDEPSNVTVNTTSTSTVTGSVASGTSDSLICFSTSAGTMQIKLDSTTDTSSCGVLTIGKTVQIVCGRGSDAYMHAIKITNYGASASTATINGVTMPNITGTVGQNTSSRYLYLTTGGGRMELKIDSTTDISGCKALIPSQSVSVACYRGSDAYMHAARIISNETDSFQTASVNTSSTVTVAGVVSSGTTPYLMYLSTTGGMMQIRLDSGTNMNGSPVVLGETVQVSLGYGSDYYHHAISVSEL